MNSFDVDIDLLQGKLQVEDKGAQGFSQPHNFQKNLFLTPTNCDYCLQLIIGFVSKGTRGKSQGAHFRKVKKSNKI
jgi:hypothetical protein